MTSPSPRPEERNLGSPTFARAPFQPARRRWQQALRALAWLSCAVIVSGCAQTTARDAEVGARTNPRQTPSTGRIERWADFPSRHVPPRHIDIWLPDGYPAQAPYAVVYMHDGQMLFDATHAWNRQEWRADEVAQPLIDRGEVRPFIIVGVWNGGPRRHVEYFPQRPFESLPRATRQALYASGRSPGQKLFAGEIDSDAYLRFLVEELKPAVDRRLAVAPDRASTFVLGSSMGGLISLYAALEYPEVFGAAACLSTHWPGTFETENNPLPAAFSDYIASRLPPPGRLRFYFDHGTATLDALYPPLQREVDLLFASRGYAAPDYLSLQFPGAEHSENAWAARLDQPLRFLLRREARQAE